MQRISRRRALIAGGGMTASLLAGCSDGDNGGDQDPADRGPIGIAELAFAAERPDDLDEYEPQPESTYSPTELVWVYADFSELAGEPTESEDDDGGTDPSTVAIDLQQTVTVENPDGEQVVEAEERFEEELAVRQLDGFYTGTEILLDGRPAAGEYTTTLSVTDLVSESDATESATFRIEE